MKVELSYHTQPYFTEHWGHSFLVENVGGTLVVAELSFDRGTYWLTYFVGPDHEQKMTYKASTVPSVALNYPVPQ